MGTLQSDISNIDKSIQISNDFLVHMSINYFEDDQSQYEIEQENQDSKAKITDYTKDWETLNAFGIDYVYSRWFSTSLSKDFKNINITADVAYIHKYHNVRPKNLKLRANRLEISDPFFYKKFSDSIIIADRIWYHGTYKTLRCDVPLTFKLRCIENMVISTEVQNPESCIKWFEDNYKWFINNEITTIIFYSKNHMYIMSSIQVLTSRNIHEIYLRTMYMIRDNFYQIPIYNLNDDRSFSKDIGYDVVEIVI